MPRRRRRSEVRDHRSRGFALITVLLLIVGLTAIATTLALLTVGQRLGAHNGSTLDTRREALDGALRVALVEMSVPRPQGPWWRAGTPRVLEVAEQRIEVTVQREAGRIDLNTAREELLAAWLAVSGMEAPQARAAVARLRDWIDVDDERRPDGAERDAYRAAGLSYTPRNGPLETVEELRQVIGFERIDDAALDAVTVYSQQLDPASGDMPEGAAAAVRWLNKEAGQGRAPALPEAAPTPSNGPVSYDGQVVRLKACIEKHPEACRTLIARITGSRLHPVLVLKWRQAEAPPGKQP
jgi:general secretion pathway protein K